MYYLDYIQLILISNLYFYFIVFICKKIEKSISFSIHLEYHKVLSESHYFQDLDMLASDLRLDW